LSGSIFLYIFLFIVAGLKKLYGGEIVQQGVDWSGFDWRAVMPVSSEYRKFLLRDQALYPAFFNALFNGAITWLLFRSREVAALWGEGGFAIDLLATAFLLPLISCLIVSPLVTRQVSSGKLSPLESAAVWPLWSRALLLGFAGLLFAAVPLVLLLSLLQAPELQLSTQDYALYKALWTALIAAAVTPVIAWWALQAASSEGPYG